MQDEVCLHRFADDGSLDGMNVWAKQLANKMQTQLTSETQPVVGESRRRTSFWP